MAILDISGIHKVTIGTLPQGKEYPIAPPAVIVQDAPKSDEVINLKDVVSGMRGNLSAAFSDRLLIFLLLATLPQDDPVRRWLTVMMAGRKLS